MACGPHVVHVKLSVMDEFATRRTVLPYRGVIDETESSNCFSTINISNWLQQQQKIHLVEVRCHKVVTGE
jgi:hypothetical protein